MFTNKTTICLAATFALRALSAPLPQDCDDVPVPGVSFLTVEGLTAIAPKTASCAGADFPEECADATNATIAINKSFDTYSITTVGEQAALVAYMLFESGDFKYNRNHFPGRPGQGTRMMAMPKFVRQYATAVAGPAAVATVEAAQAGNENGTKNAVLDLVNKDDEKSFGSAAWFLTSTCTPEVRAGLVAQTVDGWHAFLTACVDTTLAEERDTPWTAAKQIMLGK